MDSILTFLAILFELFNYNIFKTIEYFNIRIYHNILDCKNLRISFWKLIKIQSIHLFTNNLKIIHENEMCSTWMRQQNWKY
jgi:hypothetical protein